jgi:hypothetical protein
VVVNTVEPSVQDRGETVIAADGTAVISPEVIDGINERRWQYRPFAVRADTRTRTNNRGSILVDPGVSEIQ